MRTGTILEKLLGCSDAELAGVMRYIRIDGEPVVSVKQLRHVLREEKKRMDEKERMRG